MAKERRFRTGDKVVSFQWEGVVTYADDEKVLVEANGTTFYATQTSKDWNFPDKREWRQNIYIRISEMTKIRPYILGLAPQTRGKCTQKIGEIDLEELTDSELIAIFETVIKVFSRQRF